MVKGKGIVHVFGFGYGAVGAGVNMMIKC